MLTVNPMKLLSLKSPVFPLAVVVSNGSVIENRTNTYFHNIPRLTVSASTTRDIPPPLYWFNLRCHLPTNLCFEAQINLVIFFVVVVHYSF